MQRTSRKGIKIRKKPLARRMLENWRLYAILAVPLIWLIVFCYVPIGGVAIAFQNYSLRKGIASGVIVPLPGCNDALSKQEHLPERSSGWLKYFYG